MLKRYFLLVLLSIGFFMLKSYGEMIPVARNFNNVDGVKMEVDDQGRVHLVYFVFNPLELTENQIFSKHPLSVQTIKYEDKSWSEPVVITTECSNYLRYSELIKDNGGDLHFLFQRATKKVPNNQIMNTAHFIFTDNIWKNNGTVWDFNEDTLDGFVYSSNGSSIKAYRKNDDSLMFFNLLSRNNRITYASFVYDINKQVWNSYVDMPFYNNCTIQNELYSYCSDENNKDEIRFAYFDEDKKINFVSLGEANSMNKKFLTLIGKGPEQLHLFWTEDLIELGFMVGDIVCPLIRHALSYDKGRTWEFVGDTVFYDPLEFGNSGTPFWEGAWDIHPFVNSRGELFVTFKYMFIDSFTTILYVYSWNEDTFQWEKRYEVNPGLCDGVIDHAFFDDTIYIFTRSKISSGINGGDDYSMGMIYTVDVSPPKLAGSREASTDGAVAELSLFPNPGKDRLSLRLSWDEEEKIKVRVFNLMGRTVYETYTAKREVTVNCSSWASGCYLVCVEGKDRQVRRKWMKVK